MVHCEWDINSKLNKPKSLFLIEISLISFYDIINRVINKTNWFVDIRSPFNVFKVK